MTFVVALACSDGAVLGADGMAMLTDDGGAAWGRTRSGEKVRAWGGAVLWAATGEVSAIQAAAAAMALVEHEIAGRNLRDVADGLASLIVQVRKATVQRYREIYDGLRMPSIPGADFVFVGWDGEEARVLTITRDGERVWQDEVGYAFDGLDVAQHFALPRLDAIEPRSLTVTQGCSAVHRIIREAIANAAGGIGDPVSVWSVSDAGAFQWSPEGATS